MPMYDYKCPVCQRKREVMLKLANLESSVYCQRDGFAMTRQISAPYIQTDYPAYESPVVPGKWIEGRKAHEQHLRETGCRVLEPGESSNYQKRIAQENEKFEAAVDATADELIATLPQAKKEQLAAEMDAGLTTQYERSIVQE
jgi:putative FmdB family regulatory protein